MIHEKYISLFKEIAHATELLAQQVVEFNRAQKDEKGEQTAQTMTNDFHDLYIKMIADDFDGNTFTRGDYARLLVGVLIIVNNLENRIVNEQKAIKNYKDEIITRLEKVVNNSTSDEDAGQLANEVFTIVEEKNN